MKTLASDPDAYKKFLEEIDNKAREERFRTVSPLPSLPLSQEPKNTHPPKRGKEKEKQQKLN